MRRCVCFFSGIFITTLLAALVLSCAQSPKAAEDAVLPVSFAPAKVPAIGETAPPENRLNGPAFKDLPEEAWGYLERLSQAFISQDEAFLPVQGEPQFEATTRPYHDKETYLALLYRTGVYATESPRLSEEPSRLFPAEVSRIQYLSRKENGPLLEIKAQLPGRDGKITPCVIRKSGLIPRSSAPAE
ncbi:MAG: hypothetical protein LBG57_00680 [Treponema sp.]|jgi:hypothetical protein|nr:hypothetical protein [Treponema sp.]